MKIAKNGNKTCNIYEDLTKQVSVLIHNIIIEIDNEKYGVKMFQRMAGMLVLPITFGMSIF